ncbi:PR-1-like protein [Macroventuria anomochaeta]|uniref:PR-1-like protein n=1 Tax=Macroventuria anomochaeta TaxID=301207 RepID=A0ACB6SIL2_9PLEO|nr:PR-1-like protein [Macroventuria anomochaeta]KAF2633159.1 PR-1-like protein [Macroventuria anomochaeta]
MHSSALLTSAFAVGALALPQGQLEKRQQVTVYDTVTVTVTVFVNPTTSILDVPPASSPPVVGPIAVSSTPVIVAPSPSVGVLIRPSSSSVNAPEVPSSVAPTSAPSGAPLDPEHTSGVGQATLSAGLAYQNAILYHHNAARANHGAAPLVWDNAVAWTAAQAANLCRFEHYIPAGAGQGQNLFTVSGNFFNVTAGITESWYKGEFQPMMPYFGAANIPDDVFHNVGHLTQVLWKGTTRVGCISIDCGNRMIVGGATSSLNKYTVCNYAPAGNVAGQYAINVGRPSSTSNLGSWSN